MEAARTDESPSRIIRWVAVGALGGLILGLMASLLIRPPIEDRQGLEVALASDGSVHAVFLGGSLTDGAWVTAEAAAFNQRVAYGLGVPVTIDRGGVNRSSLDDVMPILKITGEVNLVVIELGSGNLYTDRTPPDEFAPQYRELLDKVRERAADSALVCLGVWAGTGNAEQYDKRISSECVSHGGVFVPIADIYDEPGMRGPAGVTVPGGVSDDFHPNDSGHAAIAERILSNLRLEESED